MTTLVMDKPKGGRGHRGPYETKQMRVPSALESQIEELTLRYRNWISESSSRMEGIGVDNPPCFLDKSVDNFNEVEQLSTQLAEAYREIDRLKSAAGDLEVARDRVLAGLKLGRQSPGYKSAAKVLSRFLTELRK